LPLKSTRNSTLWIGKDPSKAGAMQIKLGTGNFSWTEAQTIEYEANQGKISSTDGGVATQGDDVPMAVQFDAIFEFYYDCTIGSVVYQSPVELLQSETRADGDACGPPSVHLWLDTTIECADETQVESLMFPRFRWESLNYDSDAGRISCSGNCLAVEPILVDRT